MPEQKHIIIFSHGFGVRKDDCGLFTDIASAFPMIQSIMFDYNEVDLQNNTITVRPFSVQAEMLNSVITEQKQATPNAVIDLVCHSQGCRVAAMADLSGVRKAILIAPPTDVGIERTLERYKNNPKAEINLLGTTKLPRSDGSMTLIPAEYWRERRNEDPPVDLYNKLADVTEAFIIKAKQDNVLGDTIFEGLDNRVVLIELDGDHNFTNSRVELCETIKNIIL